ncbi:F0F1 ATP synthase subunit epsilon [Nostoc sp. 'Peltigera malacea cyanobiont' DB3992]|uniref:F0F1 ATP synthase subunit epsilon n=1 Tax=Nostoc sp. 'Peltigera malacea cyanobiont' DB3992 TaxID=1206980 RepID=UPI00211F24B6|nr:F0F1 ATP synthase subunit epsilon [Nostoc sp. 'Peltigera malacea cyanobiont' DB3992]
MTSTPSEMRLKVVLPTKILMETAAIKVIAEAENGIFCLLPRHIDFVATLIPSLLSFVSPQGQEQFFAIDQGILIKHGDEVTVATQNAVQGGDLGMLKKTVEQQFHLIDEREKTARSVLEKLEINTIRHFIQLGEYV